MRKRFLCIICCSMLAFSGCGVGSSVVNSGNYESKNQSKTIEKYLGKDYKVTSSKGHIRDLATSGKFGLGVDIENNFKPNYKVITGKGKLVTELKKEVKNSDYVILATDPDREGEAISWHLKDALGLKVQLKKHLKFLEK